MDGPIARSLDAYHRTIASQRYQIRAMAAGLVFVAACLAVAVWLLIQCAGSEVIRCSVL